MERNSIDKIKVTQLCKEVGISRATFYSYFENIYSVATWAWDQVLDQTLYTISEGSSFVEAHKAFFDRINANRHFFSRAFRTHDHNSTQNYGYRIMAEQYLRLIPERLGRELTATEQMAVKLYTAGAAFHTSRWAQEGMRESPQFMAESFAMAAPRIFDCLQSSH